MVLITVPVAVLISETEFAPEPLLVTKALVPSGVTAT